MTLRWFFASLFCHTRWAVNFWPRYWLSNLSVLWYLNMRCSDFDLSMADYPRCYIIGLDKPILCSDGEWHTFYKYAGASAHYTCCVSHIFDFGRGRGYTPMQAARRAVRHMNNKKATP